MELLKASKINWASLAGALVKLLGVKLVSDGLTSILIKLVSFAGIQNWLVSFLVKNLTKQIIIPCMNAAIVEGQFVFDKETGKANFEKLEAAENEAQYNDAINSIVG